MAMEPENVHGRVFSLDEYTEHCFRYILSKIEGRVSIVSTIYEEVNEDFLELYNEMLFEGGDYPDEESYLHAETRVENLTTAMEEVIFSMRNGELLAIHQLISSYLLL